MKKDYMVSNSKPFAAAQKQVIATLDKQILKAFNQIKESQDICQPQVERLHSLLMKCKKIKSINQQTKSMIFGWFLKRELSDLNFVRLRDKYTLKILKLTKITIKDYKLEWRDVLAKFESSLESTQKVAGLYEFLSILRRYYDCNNALEVLEYFKGRYSFSNEMTWFYIEKFAQITQHTDLKILRTFLTRLREFNEMEEMKDIYLWRWILRIKKKSPKLDLAPELELLSNQLLKKFLQIQNKQKNSSQVLNTKFLGEAFSNLIGKQNPQSCTLIRMFFQTFKNSFVAFQQAKQNIKFLAIFLGNVKDRKLDQDKMHKKIQKIQQAKQQEQSEEDVDDEKEDDADDIGVSNLVGNYVVIAESQDEEEEPEATSSNKEHRIQRINLKLENQLTKEILDCLKEQVEIYLEDIFFVQSKEASKALGEIFVLYPDLAEKSIPYLLKGIEIPELNVSILMKSAKKLLQALLTHCDPKKMLGDVLLVLNGILNIRYIKQGWNTINFLIANIPLLDEQDCAAVDAQHKDFFEKHFDRPHDKFYEIYTELVFQAFKRFLQQNEAKQKKKLMIQNPFNNLSINSYKFFDKRCIIHAMQTYMSTQSLYLHYYLQLKTIPPSLVGQFTHDQLVGCQGAMLDRQLSELILAARSVDFKTVREFIEAIANHDAVGYGNDTVRSILESWIYENVYFHCAYKPIKSSLEHLLPHHSGRGDYHLVNHHLQHVDDSIKGIVNLWRDEYNYVNAFLKDAEREPIKIDTIDIICKMHFQTFDIDYNARKQLIGKLNFLKTVVQTFPYHKCLVSKDHLLKQVVFQNFKDLEDLNSLSVKLLERLMRVALHKFPHDHRFLSLIRSYAVGVIECEETQFDMYYLDMKDLRKLEKKSENQGISTYYLLCSEVDLRISLLNHAVAFERDKIMCQPLQKYLLIMAFHPDEQGLPLADHDFNSKLTPIILDLIHMKIPQNVDKNKRQRFLLKIAQVINDYGGQTKTQFTGPQLYEMIEFCIEQIGSSERKIREGYLAALKALIGKIELTRVDTKVLEEKILQGIKNQNPKQKLIWSICLILASTGKTVDFSKLYKGFSDLLFEDDYLMRKASLFLTSFVTRSIRIHNKKIQTVKDLGPYAPKTLAQFQQTGYLRPQHIKKGIQRKALLRKYKAYCQLQIPHKHTSPQILTFISDPQKCRKFIQNYQTDQISTQQDVLYLLRKPSIVKEITELADLLGWLIKKYIKFVKLKKHKLSVYERLYGERFFKYLFEVDAQSGYQFFENTKGLIAQYMEKTDTMDNQMVISNYTSNLLFSYSKRYRDNPNKDVESFCMKIISEIMEKGSGQFWVLFSKLAINNLQQLPFLTAYFESLTPTSVNYYRAVQKLITIHTHRYQKLLTLLKTIFNAGVTVNNPAVLKLIRSLISFSDIHYIDKVQIQKSKILDLQKLLAQKSITQATPNLYIPTTKDFHDVLIDGLSKLLHSEQIEDRKIGSSLLYDSINAVCEENKTRNSIGLLSGLCSLVVNWLGNNKEEFKTERSPLLDSIVSVLSEIFDPEDFKVIMKSTSRLLTPQPQTAHYLNLFYKNPYNFIKQSQQDYQNFIRLLLTLLDNPLLYKQVLLCISGLLYYRKLGRRDIPHSIVQAVKTFTDSKRNQVVLFMALLLSDLHNLKLYAPELEFIITETPKNQKDKVKTWAKIMVDSRGKAELIEDEETKALWNKVKAFSNPYFYHA